MMRRLVAVLSACFPVWIPFALVYSELYWLITGKNSGDTYCAISDWLFNEAAK